MLFICCLILLHQVSLEDTGRGRLLRAGTAGAKKEGLRAVPHPVSRACVAGSLLLLMVFVFSLGLGRVGFEGKLHRILILI